MAIHVPGGFEHADGFFESGRTHGIQNVHLITGEDIIGDVTEDLVAETLTITKPVIPNIGFDQTKFRVGLLPLRPYLGNTPEVTLARAHVLYVVPVNDQMESMYLEFTTGLVRASALPPPSSLQVGR